MYCDATCQRPMEGEVMCSESKPANKITWSTLAAIGAALIALLVPAGHFIGQGFIKGLGLPAELAGLDVFSMQLWGFYGLINISTGALLALLPLASVLIVITIAGTTGLFATKSTRAIMECCFLFLLSPVKRLIDWAVPQRNEKRRQQVLDCLEFIYVFCFWGFYALIALIALILTLASIANLPSKLINVGEEMAKEHKARWGKEICVNDSPADSSNCIEINSHDGDIELIGIVIYKNEKEIGLITPSGPLHTTLPDAYSIVPYSPPTQ